MKINVASVPGHCIMEKYGSTNGEALGWTGQTFNLDRVRILYHAVKDRLQLLTTGVEAVDDLKMFVKPEPHKLSKIAEERYRLISGVSLVDSMIDRILFQPLFDKILSTAGQTSTMIGWSPLGNGSSVLLNILGHADKYLALDRKCWDWTFKHWLLEELRKFLLSMIPCAPQYFVDLTVMRFKLLFNESTFRFPDGLVIKQKSPGVMKSGCFLTILLNSLGQVFLHELAELVLDMPLPPLAAMGDDTTTKFFDRYQEYVEYLESLGFKIKVSITVKPEFCGYTYDWGYYLPEYRDKHAFILQHLTLDKEVAKATLMSYQYMYYHSEEVKEFLRNLAELWEIPSAILDDHRMLRVTEG